MAGSDDGCMTKENENQNANTTVLERLQLDTPTGIRVGQPRSTGALSLVPLFHEGPAATYTPYAAIQGSGLVEVREVSGGGQVNTLVATNRSDLPVLLLEGEILEGMQQTRVLNVTILLPAKTKLEIPVSCVEAGRWSQTSIAAMRSPFHMSPRARSRKNVTVAQSVLSIGTFASNQAEVWASVDDELRAHDVESSTFEHAEIGRQKQAEIEETLAQLEPDPGQCGVFAVLGGRPMCMDLFDRASTLEAVWSGLVGSYAMDAMTVRKEADAARDVGRAITWLKALPKSTPTSHPGVGLGTNVVLSSPKAGAAGLVVDDAIVHLGAFAIEGGGSRFTRPSRRARQYDERVY
jgi:hypothetical protein